MKIRLAGKLCALMVAVGAAPLIVAGLVTNIISSNAFERQSFEQLTSVRALKSDAIGSYLALIRGQIVTMAANSAVARAASEFTSAFWSVQSELRIDGNRMDALRGLMDRYRSEQFQAQYRDSNDGTASDLSKLTSGMSTVAEVMQGIYIGDNEHPLGSKDALTDAGTGSSYDALHAEHHPSFRQFLKEFGYYDIFLVEPSTGHIVYSVFKELDFGTSLLNGPYADTNFGAAFRRALTLEKGETAFVDFAQYLPSYDSPASFISSPVFDGGKLVGVLIVQMPLSRITQVMSERAGLGETGESYLVGEDYLMRSDSYLDPVNRSVLASFRSPESGSVRTEASESALNGETGIGLIDDYRGQPVLSAFAPIDALGVRWAIMVEIDEAEAFAAVTGMQRWLIALSGLLLIAVAAIAVLLARGVSRPIIGVTSVMSRLARGDLTVDGLDATRADEIGDMVRAVEVFRAQAVETEELRRKQEEGERQAREERRQALMRIAERFEGGVGKVIRAVTESVDELQSTAKGMSDHAAKSTGEADTANGAAEHAAGGVQTVASAADQLGRSISEISELIARSTGMVKDVAGQSRNATGRIHDLKGAVEQIGSVVTLIQDIAERTKLLALNATIEAARAGESGKGFAVVANEVKQLASQTASATDDITRHVGNVQDESASVVQVIESIAASVEQVSEASSAVAAAVEEQNTATREISRSAEDGAKSTQTVFDAITQVKWAAGETGVAANQVVSSTEELSRQASILTEQVGEFLRDVRTA